VLDVKTACYGVAGCEEIKDLYDYKRDRYFFGPERRTVSGQHLSLIL
jgi:hypothetical protein